MKSNKRFKILLIEDDPDLREVYCTKLSRKYDVVSYSEADDALTDYIQQPDADLIITDQFMPNKNGTNLIRDLMFMNPNQKFAIVTGALGELDNLKTPNVQVFYKPIDILKVVQECMDIFDFKRTA